MATTANVVDSLGDVYGTVENWYSPDCGTNWSEVFVSGGATQTVSVQACTSSYCTDRYTAQSSYAWSNMVYAPTTTAIAKGWIVNTANPHYQGYGSAAA